MSQQHQLERNTPLPIATFCVFSLARESPKISCIYTCLRHLSTTSTYAGSGNRSMYNQLVQHTIVHSTENPEPQASAHRANGSCLSHQARTWLWIWSHQLTIRPPQKPPQCHLNSSTSVNFINFHVKNSFLFLRTGICSIKCSIRDNNHV